MKKCMSCMQEYDESYASCPVCGYSDEQMRKDIAMMPDALHPETILATRFIVGRVLSLTDFSAVYTCWDALLERRVAIREYFPLGLAERGGDGLSVVSGGESEHDNFEQGLVAFEEEARTLSSCQDLPGIVHIYRSFRENGTAYQVMEYLQGETLQDRINEKKALDKPEADDLLIQLLNVLSGLHERGVVHGNLAPENIYLDAKGQIRLLDFGKTKALINVIMKGRTAILDDVYTAPEVLGGKRAVPASDMYSVGALYYHMLTGQDPRYSGKKQKKKMTGDPQVDRLLQILMNPDLSERPQNASVLQQMLAGRKE